MKTLKQWFDSLSAPTQEWVENQCDSWFDKSQDDYYRKPTVDVKTKEDLEKVLSWTDENTNFTRSTLLNINHLAVLQYMHNTMPDVITGEDIDKVIATMVVDRTDYPNDIWLNMSTKEKQSSCFWKLHKNYSSNLHFNEALFFVKDFDRLNEELNWDKTETPEFCDAVAEIIGMEKALDKLERAGAWSVSRMIQPGKQSVLFDQIFFCENRLSKAQKHTVIENAYANTYHMPEPDVIKDFFSRIVAVDHSYLKELYTIISRYPAIAMKLYNQKKPDSELTGNEKPAEQYQYSPDIRKMFAIAHACALKRVSKNKGGMVKEIAPLLKIYGYNWNDIYDAMYPEEIDLN